MHFSIPDTSECFDEGGSAFTAFNIHINGVYHCSVRYKQFHTFHEQVKKEYGSSIHLPTFPPKKLLSLTPNQLEERRSLLEKYIQTLSQCPNISSSNMFNGFLLSAQQESQQEEPERVTLDVFLMNGHKISIPIFSTDQTDDVLESVASQVELQDAYVYYFGLFLIRKESGSENAIIRKLQEFESPYISLKAANKTCSHRIVLRKSYWDPAFDDELMTDRIAMNLLFVQAVSDLERGWVMASKEQHKQLVSLQQRGSKKEYLRLARTLPFYGFLQFRPCQTDYPQPDSRAVISAGNRELNFRIQSPAQGDVKEVSFKVTRMRCWRISTVFTDSNGVSQTQHPSDSVPSSLELAFEYLVSKDNLVWITVYSEQAILMSMSLQGMVDELIMKKSGRRMKKPSDRSHPSVSRRTKADNGVVRPVSSEPDSPSLPHPASSGATPSNKDTLKSLSDRITGKASGKSGVTKNDMFLETGIGDEDL